MKTVNRYWNDQTHTKYRKFPAIKIRKCQRDLDGPCKSDREIDDLLRSVLWTYYMAHGVARLGDSNNKKGNPIEPIDTFFK